MIFYQQYNTLIEDWLDITGVHSMSEAAEYVQEHSPNCGDKLIRSVLRKEEEIHDDVETVNTNWT